MSHSPYWTKYHEFLLKYHKLVLVFWLIITILSAIWGPKFFGATSVQDDELPGTPSATAMEAYRHYYPIQARQSSMVVLLSISDHAQSVDPNMTLVNTPLAHAFQSEFEYQMNASWHHEINGIYGYYSFINTNRSLIADAFITHDNKSMMISIDYDYQSHDARGFVHDVRNRVEGIRNNAMNSIDTSKLSPLAKDVNSYDVGATGTELMIDDCADESEQDFVNMDTIVLPIALLVLALYLSNLRLMIIPILSVGITLLTSCLIMYIIAVNLFKVASFTPSIMVSCIIAMSIDYSLFLLTRFKEEITHGRDIPDAVQHMILQAGHVVLVSGTTLAVCFSGLIFLPLNFLQSCGMGAAAALVCCMAVNLSLTPALLLTFPNFFATFTVLPACCHTVWPFASCIRRWETWRGRGQGMLDGQIPLINQDDMKSQQREQQQNSRWFRIATLLTKPKYAIIFLIVTLSVTLPICYYATEIRTSSDTNLLFPRDSSSAHVFNKMKTVFSPGAIDPYRIIMSVHDNSTVLTPQYFDVAASLIDTLLATKMMKNDSIQSIVYYQGIPVPLVLANMALNGTNIPPESEKLAEIYRGLYNQSVSEAGQQASIIEIHTDFDPNGNSASDFIGTVRSILSSASFSPQACHFSYYLVGGSTKEVDALHEISRLFPILVGSTTAIVFIIVAVIFRSVLVPVRLLLTITLGLSFVYGLSVLVFQHGIFDRIFPVLKDVHALYYYIPVMTFSILVGLSCDYDVFLFQRIAEYRRLGYTNQAAMVKAMYKTGSIITAAGLIMTVAFGGLAIAQTMVLNQYGFILCIAVLVDTFVIRTLLVPAIYTLFGAANWWPGKMPPEQYDVDAFIELHDVNDRDPDLSSALDTTDVLQLSPRSMSDANEYRAVL